jgi:hypothetical protein
MLWRGSGREVSNRSGIKPDPTCRMAFYMAPEGALRLRKNLFGL